MRLSGLAHEIGVWLSQRSFLSKEDQVAKLFGGARFCPLTDA
eukprot:COSAG06_NODE_2429_length_6891_cov_159.822733_4_plen_42_part_00